MEHIMAIDAMEFLEGDQILAVSGTGYNSTSKLWFFDLRNRTVIREHELNYTLYYPYEAVEVVGDRLVCLSKSGWYATISLENYNLTSTGTGPFEEWAHFDQYEDEWMFIHGHYNLSYYGESLGNQAWTWSDQCPYLNELTWTHVEKGDVVLAVSNRPEGGHQLHLWRDVDEQGREGMRLVSVLNISRKVYMMEADPAYPGIVAVSTTDGYFALYHVNVSGYPPAPTEIGNVPINGTIDWPVVDNNGNGGNDTNNTNTTGDGSQDAWGSSPPGLLVAGLLVAIIALLVTFVWLRRMGPRS